MLEEKILKYAESEHYVDLLEGLFQACSLDRKYMRRGSLLFYSKHLWIEIRFLLHYKICNNRTIKENPYPIMAGFKKINIQPNLHPRGFFDN